MNSANAISRCLCVSAVTIVLFAVTGCDVERRKSDAELGLNPQQAARQKTLRQLLRPLP